MTTKYLRNIGGATNWSNANSWSTTSGGPADTTVPTAADDVKLDANSGGATNLTVDGTSGSPSLCRSLDCTGFTGTLTWGASQQMNIGDASGGSYKTVAGMTFSPATSALLKFLSTTTGNTITTGGKDMPGGTVTFDGVGGAWQFQDSPATNRTPTYSILNGSVDFNGKNIIGAMSSSNSNTRTITMGAGTWTLSGSTGWETSTTTGLTFSGGSVTLSAANVVSANMTLNFGGLTLGTLTANAVTSGILTINGSPTFTTCTLSTNGSPNATVGAGFALGGNLTVTGTLTLNGNSVLNRNFLYSSIAGTQRTVSAGTLTATQCDFRDIIGTGAANWNVSAITGGAGNCGNNTGITFAAPKNCYMKTAVSVNWSGSNWYTTSGGSTPISPVIPLMHDIAIFDANSVTAGSKTITIDAQTVRIPATDFTGVLNTPAFARGGGEVEVYGSLTLVSGMTHTGTAIVYMCGQGAHTFDGGGLTWPTSSTLKINCGIGTYTMARNFTSNAGLTMLTGTLAQAGFTSAYGAGITITGGTWSGAGACSGTSMTVGGGTNGVTGTYSLTSALTLSSGITVSTASVLNVPAAGITGHTTLNMNGTSAVMNLSGTLNGSGAVTLSAGTTTDTTTAGEIKGSTMAISGGTHTIRKMTMTSTITVSGSSTILNLPVNANGTYGTSFTNSSTGTSSINCAGKLVTTGLSYVVNNATGGNYGFVG